jgi:DnaJ-class molecular chaperone
MEGETHYQILGIEPDANQDKIHRAYTDLLKEAQTIPDSEGLRAFMARAKVAHQVLSHPESRALYHEQMAMDQPEQRRWEVEGETKGDLALKTAISVTSLFAPIVVVLLIFTGNGLGPSLMLGFVFTAVCFAVSWAFVKFWIRMRDSDASAPAQE